MVAMIKMDELTPWELGYRDGYNGYLSNSLYTFGSADDVEYELGYGEGKDDREMAEDNSEYE